MVPCRLRCGTAPTVRDIAGEYHSTIHCTSDVATVPDTVCGTRGCSCAPGTAGEPLRAELLAAIQGSTVALKGRIETVAMEVNLLWVDLRKVSEKVKVAEGSIVEMQTEVGSLRKQTVQINSTVGRLEARLEDAEGRVFVVERAHKALVAPPRPGTPQRAIIARLLNYKDRYCILRAAQES
ncbi:hypothetical protein NDU88_003253 [Pleurodeles waltl]|uniref:Uncharacterized protein n=1 Tax=Pleurodeles waltl TaxID=8319 RepID=A0AAV7W5G1_PLEWA|nr:hypothetical protein NDU88_003253 [Pleurodeles waltl]